MKIVSNIVFACLVTASIVPVGTFGATADAATDGVSTKTPTKAELGAMLAKCSAEADEKGLTVAKGKGEARKAYRRACMLKNGVAPKAK